MGDKKKILIIDDETMLVEMLANRLEESGYEVFSAHDGEAGLKAAFEHLPDLILLDMQIPKLNGIQFYRAISTPHGRTQFPVIVLTARAELRELFRQIDADGFIQKPFEGKELLQEIERILTKRDDLDVFILDLEKNPQVGGVQKALEADKYKVLVVDHLGELARLALTHKPKFVLVEYMQLSMSGQELIRRIKEIFARIAPSDWAQAREVSVIAYSNSGMDYRTLSLDAGADRYVNKPDSEALVSAIRALELEKKNYERL